jgi:hypothetical protein
MQITKFSEIVTLISHHLTTALNENFVYNWNWAVQFPVKQSIKLYQNAITGWQMFPQFCSLSTPLFSSECRHIVSSENC